jgi:hypothetical protein
MPMGLLGQLTPLPLQFIPSLLNSYSIPYFSGTVRISIGGLHPDLQVSYYFSHDLLK